MKIRIRYFASFREAVGQAEETLTVPAGIRVAEVRELVLKNHQGLQPIMQRSTYAVNRSYVPAETELHENDELVFIPPMGGGRPMEEAAACNQ
ncbi:MoaD/ThiS family protein [Ktedonosporobacter rubrisoli]|uniref:Molybdopterin synthase sulfur carrier subunit n=1 Tax=Ktedonosporobacter rubrisoli TaxID=2509675 RepID=A0A4P6K144_KTERU|nr:MoaD/ThiS family protein [Ktedonosporobacter rubrisoli]QBD81918.1 MoaD/ThiS family protein [Ktedonosporobacter rubrisoli]